MGPSRMRRGLKRRYRELVDAPPGRRFTRYHRRRRTREAPCKRAGYLGAGIAVMLLGVILSVPPGVPGFVVTLLGIGMIAARSAIVAKAMDRAELALRRFVRAVSNLRR